MNLILSDLRFQIDSSGDIRSFGVSDLCFRTSNCSRKDFYPSSPPMSSSKLRILVIGSGGREHALSWKLSQSPNVDRVYVAPGNGGTSSKTGSDKIENVAIAQNDFKALVAFAVEKNVSAFPPHCQIDE